jgi:hypothetical protein
VYRALVKTMNSCTCPVVKEMLLNELFRQYRLLADQLNPKWVEMQQRLAQIREAHGYPTYTSGCGDVS